MQVLNHFQLTFIPLSDNSEKVLKLQIYVLDMSANSSNINALEGQQELIELKKKELADIKKKIIETQTKQKEIESTTLDKKEDKLYNKWLNNIKNQLK